MKESPNRHEETVVLSLGSNLGRREEAILEAIRRLGTSQDIIIETISSLYETDPVGLATDRLFINAICIARTTLAPLDLLAICQKVENSLGRLRSRFVPDRTIDIDVIAFGNRTTCNSDLILPHPRAKERLFVLLPLCEVCPGFVLPPDGVPIEQLLKSLGAETGCTRISSRGEIE